MHIIIKQHKTLSSPNQNNQILFTMNLPTNVTVEILARLPAKTIIQCKTVCKTWLQLITHPHFTSLHFSLARPGLIVHHSEMFKNFFKLVDFEDSYDRHGLPHESMVRFSFADLSNFPDANIVVDGSVNGLLFLREINYKHETLYICNPLTREYFQLPRPSGLVRYPMVVTHGFGLTRKNGEYKIVRLLHQRELNPINGHCVGVPFSECQVYSFKTRAWRDVDRGGPAHFAYDSHLIGLFFQGNIHWLIQDLEGPELISCFDLENEVFRPFPSPFPGRRVLGSLGVLRGCLSLCDNTDHQNIDIWAMREYGVEKTWAKEIVIRKTPELVGPSFQIVYALKVFEDGNVLMLWGDFFMFYYCSKSRVAEEVDMDQPRGPNSIEAIYHIPSFLSLKSFVTENVCKF